MQKTVLAVLATTLLAACSNDSQTTADAVADGAAEPDYAMQAAQLAASSIIVDTHIDVPYRLESSPDDISQATQGGDFDYPRAIQGGLNAPFMSIYTPASLEPAGQSYEVAERLIDLVHGFEEQWPEKFAVARSVADVRKSFADGIIALPLGMENGSPVEGDLARVQYFYDRGIRYITPAHGKTNHISDSSYDSNKPWGGLSEFGVEVIKEMNRVGIMVDVSHVSDDAFWQIMEISSVPVIASHSSARHFTPGFERNMSDEMIVAMAKAGGVIQINFGSSFITQAARNYGIARQAAGEAYRAANPELTETYIYKNYSKIYAEEHGPLPRATLDDVLDHFDHVVAIAGIDHVGIGSDYDGVGDTLPLDLRDVASYPNLIEGLLRRGYSDAEIKKVLGENLLRVWKAAEVYAATTSSST